MQFKRILKYVSFILLLGFFTFLYGFTSARNSAKKVTDIVIEFEKKEPYFLNHEIVNKLLIQNNETVKNQAKTEVDLYCLEKSVLKNPYVESATVYLGINGVLTSLVKQRSPIMRIFNEKSSYYVDKKGVKVPVSENFSARVPLITGINTDDDLSEVIALMQLISQDEFLQKEIIGVHKNEDNEYEFAVRSGDYKIEFGTFEKISLKFKKLKAFYNVAYKDKTIAKYKSISVKFHNQVVCTK